MLALLPIACFAASVAWLWLKDGGSCSDRSWRRTFISACVLWGVLVTGITELLSLANWIYPLCLAIAWLLVLTAVAGRSVILLSRQPRAVRLPFVDIDNHELALLACLVLVVAVTGVVAAISAPNTWDSMTYHMSRVAHWIQNRSIADYPTHILRQLHQSPWAEYAVMNLQLLGGTDRLANFVQWFSMIGSLIGVSLIIEELGGDRFVQMLGAAIAATIPMGILQASSTQNDFVVSFWLACFTYFVLRIRRTQGQSTPDLPVICGTGASLGLAILTKATAYLFALPFCLVTIAIVLRRPKLRLVGSLTVVPILALALNVGQYQRNMAVYGSPLGPSQEENGATYANATFSAQVLVSNALRNISLHLGTPDKQLNAGMTTLIERVHSHLGLSASDPATTWPSTSFSISTPALHEDTAGNPLHVVLIVFAGLSLITVLRRFPCRFAAVYAAAATAGFLAFCFYLRWQPWNSRLHLPVFVLLSPVLALSLRTLLGRPGVLCTVSVLMVAATPALLLNQSRPLIGAGSILAQDRTREYFANRPELAAPYTGAAQVIRDRGCVEVGLLLTDDSWEYPLWVLFNEPATGQIHLRHVNVSNASTTTAAGSYVPVCGIVSIDTGAMSRVESEGVSYFRAWASPPVAVYLR